MAITLRSRPVNRFFQDKVAVVTGASSGIGKETALALGRAGARVVLVARRGEVLRQVVADNPQLRLLPIVADVTRPEAAAGIVETTLREFGRIDILVNNAGLGMRALVAEVKYEDAQRVMELNFFAVLRCTQAVLPVMRRQHSGQVVNMISILGAIAAPHYAVYSASKFAVRAFSDTLRLEVRRDGIDVISILPGSTDTPFFASQIGGPERGTSMRDLSPACVAETVLLACRRRRREVTLPLVCRVGHWVKRLSPRFVDWSMRGSV
jgi:short-subunit dehydrogenase